MPKKKCEDEDETAKFRKFMDFVVTLAAFMALFRRCYRVRTPEPAEDDRHTEQTCTCSNVPVDHEDQENSEATCTQLLSFWIIIISLGICLYQPTCTTFNPDEISHNSSMGLAMSGANTTQNYVEENADQRGTNIQNVDEHTCTYLDEQLGDMDETSPKGRCLTDSAMDENVTEAEPMDTFPEHLYPDFGVNRSSASNDEEIGELEVGELDRHVQTLKSKQDEEDGKRKTSSSNDLSTLDQADLHPVSGTEQLQPANIHVPNAWNNNPGNDEEKTYEDDVQGLKEENDDQGLETSTEDLSFHADTEIGELVDSRRSEVESGYHTGATSGLTTNQVRHSKMDLDKVDSDVQISTMTSEARGENLDEIDRTGSQSKNLSAEQVSSEVTVARSSVLSTAAGVDQTFQQVDSTKRSILPDRVNECNGAGSLDNTRPCASLDLDREQEVETTTGTEGLTNDVRGQEHEKETLISPRLEIPDTEAQNIAASDTGDRCAINANPRLQDEEPSSPHPPTNVRSVRPRQVQEAISGTVVTGSGSDQLDIRSSVRSRDVRYGNDHDVKMFANQMMLWDIWSNLGIFLSEYRGRICIDHGRYLCGTEWELGRELGRGTFGACHEAKDRRSKFEFCVKVIDRCRFRPSEVEFLLQLNPLEGIVRIYGLLVEDGTIYIPMQLIQGQNLRAYVNSRQNRRLPWLEALRIMRPVAEAMIQMHDRDIVHEDLKEENLVRSITGQTIVIDLGLARRLINHITTGTQGTPRYCPNEKKKTGTHGSPADVFAWTITLMCIMNLEHTRTDLLNVQGNTYASRMRIATLRMIPRNDTGIRHLIIANVDENPDNRDTARQLVARIDQIFGNSEGSAACSLTTARPASQHQVPTQNETCGPPEFFRVPNHLRTGNETGYGNMETGHVLDLNQSLPQRESQPCPEDLLGEAAAYAEHQAPENNPQDCPVIDTSRCLTSHDQSRTMVECDWFPIQVHEVAPDIVDPPNGPDAEDSDDLPYPVREENAKEEE